jgi:hypothetical protein
MCLNIKFLRMGVWIFFGVLSFSLVAAAQPSEKLGCQVGVRLIEGISGVESSKVQLSRELEPVRAQLVGLPFQAYRVLGYQESLVAVDEEEAFDFLVSREKNFRVEVIPHRPGGQKVPFTVRWVDGSSGRRLVATRLRISNGSSVVLGTEDESSGSLLVAVTCSCPPESR